MKSFAKNPLMKILPVESKANILYVNINFSGSFTFWFR